MQDNGPLIALIFFILLTGLFGMMAMQRHNDLMGESPPETSKDTEIEEAREELQTLMDDIRKVKDKISATQKEIELQQVRYSLNDRREGRYKRAYQGRLQLVEIGQKFGKEADALGVKVVERKEQTASTIRKDEGALRERAEERIRKFNEKKEQSAARTVKIKKDLTAFEAKVRRDKNYVNSRRGEYMRRLTLLTEREVERANTQTEVDGKVVFADTIHNTVVINLGTSHGVRNGYRFECFRVKPGNRKISKGFLEVRKATSTMSECMIVRKLVKLPRDPLSDYVASEPEEKFSPYQESGKQGFTSQPLSARPKTVITGMNKMDPIVEGDSVQNPLFEIGKTYTFYIAGDKTITHGVQKSAIAYTWPHIERVIKFYGGKVAQDVDLGVDYIVAQKNPEDDEGFVKAKTLGIPVMYEWELFRFLNQK